MKASVLATTVLAFLIGLPIASSAGLAPDSDGDGTPDVLDNCLNVSQTSAQQCDTDTDGYGNFCDCDLNQSETCSGADLGQWKVAFNAGTPLTADHNCNGSISGADLGIWKVRFNNFANDFQSGLSCAGDPANNCTP